MFNDKEYFEVNREERHYGNLLISSIIFDDGFRDYFFNLVNNKLGKPDFLTDDFDLYTETAILRDYWFDLGDYKKIPPQKLNIPRREVINLFFDYFDIDKTIIEENSFFWSTKINQGYLNFPGKWTERANLKALSYIEQKYLIPGRKLHRIGWAFNAKPDLLIISNENCLMIEIKLESDTGKNEYGYDQGETQKDITDFMRLSIPCFKDKNFEHRFIKKHVKSSDDISWTEIIKYTNNLNNRIIKKHLLRNKIIG